MSASPIQGALPVIQENIRIYGGKFISLFQHRELAITTLAITSLVGFFYGMNAFDKRSDKVKAIYKTICAITFISLFPVTINLIVAKCLKMPYSYKVPVGLGAGVSIIFMLLVILRSDDQATSTRRRGR